MHRAIVSYIRKSHTKFIVTTNYDTCLEEALREAGVRYRRVQDETELADASGDEVMLYKIHGSAETGREDSIIFSDEQEARLPEGKKKILDNWTY